MSEYSLIQQQLDPNVEGKISRDQFLRVMKHYFATRSRTTEPQQAISSKHDAASPRVSFSDDARHTKHSETTEPEMVSELEQVDESPGLNNAPDTADCVMSAAQSMAEDVCARAWQHEFQSRLADELEGDDPVSRGLEIAAFLAEFQRAAENTVEAVVSEIALNDDARSMPSLSLDDDQFLATDYSGTHEHLRLSVFKYVVDGLIVYITHDPAAHRAFGHQIRVARALHGAIMATNSTLLQLPLQCVIDYLGFRGLVIAQSQGQQNTRILSSRMLLSCDRNNQVLIREQLVAVWSHLGIFTEDFAQGGDTSLERLPQFIGAAAGVSTAVSSRGIVCYLHNLIDIFPVDEACPGSALRPEFVAQLSERLPLYPQSCMSTLRQDQRAVLAQANVTTEEHLRGVVIPAFVDIIEAQSAIICDSFSLTEALHREGINARYLGLCLEGARSTHVKRLFLAEIVARACKAELMVSLQFTFRDAISDTNGIAKEPQCFADGAAVESSGLHALPQEILVRTSLRVCHEFFNLVFGGQESSDSKAFWQEHIVPRIQDQFIFSSREARDDLICNLPHDDLMHRPQVIQAFQYHTNVSIADEGEFHFSPSLAFLDPGCISMSPKSTMLCATTFECEKLLAQTDELAGCGRVEEALDVVKAHITIVDGAPRGDSNPALGRLLLYAADLSLQAELVDEAERFSLLALESSIRDSFAHVLAILMVIRVKVTQSKPLVELRALFSEGVDAVNALFGAVHPLVFGFYTTMIEASSRQHDHDGVDELFHDLADLIKDCYGKSSVTYADVRRNQGHVLAESGKYDEAASVLDEAFSVYDQLAQEQVGEPTILHDLKMHGATCLYMIATLQASQPSVNGREVAFSTAVRALNLREDVLPVGHPDIVSSLLQLGELCVALSDFYRAQEYYRRALIRLKTLSITEESPTYIRKVAQAVLDAHLRSLSTERLAIVEKTRSRFAAVADAMEAALAAISSSKAPRELELIRQVTHALLEQDPVEYLDKLIDNASDELQAQRRDRFASATVRRDIAAEDPVVPSQPAAPSSRFASFAMGQSLAPPPQALTTTHHDAASLLTASGEFSHGAQLATLLFLAALPDDE